MNSQLHPVSSLPGDGSQSTRHEVQTVPRYLFDYLLHELRNPLNSLQLNLDILRDRHEGDACRSATARTLGTLTEVIGDLSAALGLVESLAQPPSKLAERSIVSLNAVVAEALDGLAGMIESSGASMYVRELPSLDAQFDPLVHIVRNLVENSIKYRSTAPLKITIEEYFECDATGVVKRGFKITDNGIGVDTLECASIFARHSRGFHPDISGRGLGLALCQELVTRVGGEIFAESGHDGTTINVIVSVTSPQQKKLTSA